MAADTGVGYFDSSLGSEACVVPQSCATPGKGQEGSAETRERDSKNTEKAGTVQHTIEMTSLLVNESDKKSPNCIPNENVGSCPASKPSERVSTEAVPPPNMDGITPPTAVDKANSVPSSSISVSGTQREASQELPPQLGQAGAVPSASASLRTRSYPAEDKQLLTVDTSVKLSSSFGPSGSTAKRQKEIFLARKARKDKFFSRVAFSNSDNTYYSQLPVQPAMGWWKSVLSSRSHSLQFASRLARSLNVPIPDTVYSCSTDCFYVSTRPDALQPKTDSDLNSRRQVSTRNGWYIRSEFSAAKVLESELAARSSQEIHKHTRFSQEISTFPSVATCPASPINQSGGKTSGSCTVPLRTALSQKFAVTGATAYALPYHQIPRRAKAVSPGSVNDALLTPPDAYPAAVVKQMHYLRKDCNITKALDLTTFSTISSDTSCERLYQAFVRGRPRSRCQLTRVCWSASRAPSGFTLVNKFTPSDARQRGGDLTSQYCVSCDNPTLNGVSRTCEEEERRSADHSETSFDVIPVAGSSLESAADIARAIFHFTQSLFKIWLESLVVDLVRSAEDGAWYFLQVKSFTLRPASPPTLPSTLLSGKGETLEDGEEDGAQEKGSTDVQDLARYSIPTACHMCGLRRKKHELVRVVNQRMMLETQHHMRKRGLDVLFFTPGRRLQLSSNCPVCSLCYSLYLAEKELIEVELELARVLHQPMVKDNEAFFSFTGVMDAIQPNDPYLIDLLRSFSNAPPRQISFDGLDPLGGVGGRIDLQFSPVRDRDSVLSFATVSDERSRATGDSIVCSPAGSLHPKSTLRTPNTGNGTNSASVETAGTSASCRLPPSAPLPFTSNAVHSGSSPDTQVTASPATAPAAGHAGREGVRFPPVSSPSSRGHNVVPRSIPIGSTLVAPPKKTMHGGEAVTSVYGAKDDKWRQIPTKLYQWRMMLFLHSLQDLPRGLLHPTTSAARQQQFAENAIGDNTSELVIELKIFGESRSVAVHSSDLSAACLPAARSRSATGASPHSAAAAFSGRTVPAQSSECATSAAGTIAFRDSRGRVQRNAKRPSSAVVQETCRNIHTSRSAQYVPIKQMIVFYLFSSKPCLQQIFQREPLQFRLLASSRAAASAEAGSNCWCSCASSPPRCPVCPLPSPPTSLLGPFACVNDTAATVTAAGYRCGAAACYGTTDSCTPLCIASAAALTCNTLSGSTVRSCVHSSSCSHSCPAPAVQGESEKSPLPRSAAAGTVPTSSTSVIAGGAELQDESEVCCECGRWRRPPCLHAAAAPEEPVSAVEGGRPFRSQATADRRPSTASPGVLRDSQNIELTRKQSTGTAAQCTLSRCRPASAALGGNRVEQINCSGCARAHATSSSAGRYADLCEVAAGSCSLQRLAGMRCSKQQTYVLLFSKTCWAQPRLRLVLGLHQDMQIPSQYVCVNPYADAYLPTRPYTSPCPLPSEWLDCYSAPSAGSAYPSSSNSGTTGGRRGSALAGNARPVSAYMQPTELRVSERTIFTARGPH